MIFKNQIKHKKYNKKNHFKILLNFKINFNLKMKIIFNSNKKNKNFNRSKKEYLYNQFIIMILKVKTVR